MSEMLERMCRAISDTPATLENDVGLLLSEKAIERVARAALEAIKAGAQTVHKVPATVDGRFADSVTIHAEGWELLIDSILSNPK